MKRVKSKDLVIFQRLKIITKLLLVAFTIAAVFTTSYAYAAYGNYGSMQSNGTGPSSTLSLKDNVTASVVRNGTMMNNHNMTSSMSGNGTMMNKTTTNGMGNMMAGFPLQQIRHGVSIHDVKCNPGMQLVLKAEDGSPACVTPTTAVKLIARGWAQASQ